jgi:hypothetical protein
MAVAAFASPACDELPVTPTPTPTTRQLFYSGTLQPRAFAWRSVAIDDPGTVTVHLISVSPDIEAVIGLALGTFDGSSCTELVSIETASSPTDPQISRDVTPGAYCVRVADIGNLSTNRNWSFSISVVIPDIQ